MAKLISALNIGDKVRFGKHQVNTEAKQDIIWKVAAKNHPGYPSNSVTLVAEEIMDIRGFDAKEPSNSDSNRRNSGNNRYKDSNIRQWLNKAGKPWFVKTHTADEPPTDVGMSQPTGCNNRDGFLSAFTTDELGSILNTTLKVVKNTVTDGGGSETVVDKVFLLSTTEVGLANENSIAEGSRLPLFTSNNSSRISKATQQAVTNTKSVIKPSSVGRAWSWWLRTPTAGNSWNVRHVSADGSLYNDGAYYGYYGVRPALNLKSGIMATDSPDSNGVYTLSYNNPPILTLSTTDNRTLYENDTISLSGNAKDINNGDVVTVRYSINGASSRAITTAISDTTNIPFSKSLVFKNGKLFDGAAEVTSDLAEGSQHTLKVWATDDKGGVSEEQIRSFYVVPNRPAKLTIKPFSPAQDLIETDKITIQGNAVDPDANNIKVSYKIANGSYQEIYDGTGGDFDFLVNLSDLAVGKNTISIKVEDSYGATTVKTIEVTKSKEEEPLKQAVARYKLTPPNGSAKGIVLWIEREIGDLTIDAKIHMGMNGETENFQPMTLNSTAFVTDDIEEDEFTFEAGSEKENIILEITMNRSSTTTNKGITLISGVLS